VLAVTIADFPVSCRLNAIRFYVKEIDEELHMDFAGWVYSHGAKYIDYVKDGRTTNLYHVVWLSPTQVNITNIAGAEAAEQHAWFRVEIVDTVKNTTTKKYDYWDLDPEVINTGGGDTRNGFQSAQQGDGDQTLGA
jgi:hypothetical protein